MIPGALRLRTQLLIATIVVSFIVTIISLVIAERTIHAESVRQTESAVANAQAAFKRVDDQQRTELARTTALMSELPTLKALLTTGHSATIQDASVQFWELSGADMMILAGNDGAVFALHETAPPMEQEIIARFLRDSRLDREETQWWHDEKTLYRTNLRPVFIGADAERRQVGTIILGKRITTSVARDIAQSSASDLAMVVDQSVIASTLPVQEREALERELRSHTALGGEVQLGQRKFRIAPVQLPLQSDTPIQALLLVPLDRTYAFLHRLNETNIVLAVIAVTLGAFLVSFLAGMITQPLEKFAEAARALGKGDFEFRLPRFGSVELRELRQAFSAMREEIRTSQRKQIEAERLAALGRAAASISHDLRHHLAAVVANAEFLYEGGPDRDEILHEVRHASDQMTGLIDSLIEFGRGDRTLSLQDGDLSTIVQQAIQAVRTLPAHKDCPIEFDAHGDTVGTFDHRKLERVFLNLLLNACEAPGYGPRRVLVQLHGNGDSFHCSVWDNGRGVPEEIRPRLFEPFISSGKPNGTGLGLAITHKIVTDHGGTIRLKEETESGTCFEITLPRRHEVNGHK